MLAALEKRLIWPTAAAPPPTALTMRMLVSVVQVQHKIINCVYNENELCHNLFCLFDICTEYISARENCTDGELRLRDGTTSREGRVEICYEHQWRTVCDNNWEAEDAQVACRQLGFSSYGMFHWVLL